MIRPETAADWATCDRIHDEAFGGTEESQIVRRLREDGLIACALIAEEEGTPVGHIVFSRLAVEAGGRSLEALALAPVAVRPAYQRRGIGGALIRAGIDRMRAADFEAVIVLGHPDYYPRFGFSAALAEELAAPFSGPAFMVLELVPGVLVGKTGRVTYPAAFGIE